MSVQEPILEEIAKERVRKACYLYEIDTCYKIKHIKSPLYPEGRKDICVVQYSAETDGISNHDHGCDIFYLLWQGAENLLQCEEIFNSGNGHAAHSLRKFTVDKNKISILIRGFRGASNAKIEISLTDLMT